MPDTHPTSPAHRTHSSSHRHEASRYIHTNYLDPVLYFSSAILLLLFAKLLHTGMLSPATGVLAIIVLAISKIWKFKPGILLSIIFLLAMTMANVWEWVDSFFIATLTPGFTSDTSGFARVLSESLILAILAWIYHRLLKAIYMRMGSKWFVKKSYVIIFKLLFYFQLFLAFFWLISFLVQMSQQFTRLDTQDSAMIAGGLALLASGIPAILYLSKHAPDEKKRHHHRHHHRPGENSQQKNVDVG